MSKRGATHRAEFDFVNKNHPGNPRFDFEILSCLIWFDNDLLKSQGEWNLSEMIISPKTNR